MYHGKQVKCIHSGLISSGGRICGTSGYARVFTGTVKSVKEISDTDKRLELIPDESFLGPATAVTATVNQACMPENEPEIQPGDKWLFYLQTQWRPRQNAQDEDLVLPYDSRSGPLNLPSAQQEISTLRHLARLTDSGLIIGRVTSMKKKEGKIEAVPVSDWSLIAKGASTGIEYKTLTDTNGHFEFEVPPDRYKVTANTQHGLWAADRDPFVTRGQWAQCADVDFPMHADGGLSGTVTTADGKPASNVQVAILRISPWHEYFTVQTDGKGHFEVRGQDPGRYIVGQGPLANTIAEWRLRVYYPGVSSREQAIPIDLGDGEARSGIDFKLPATN